MDNERQEDLLGGRESQRDSDAISSLKKHAKRPSQENAPLLGDGAGSSQDGRGVSGASEWEGSADYEGLTIWRTPSMYWLLPSFLIYALAFGAIIVPRLNLTLSLICREYLIERAAADPSYDMIPVLLDSDNPQCRIPEVQALASEFALYLSVIGGSLSAIMSPKLGAISDRYGRTRILVLSSLGALVGEVITVLAAKYPDTVKYQWLLLGGALDGLCGSFTTGMAITHAYAADCTPPAKRAVAFGYFHACLFTGIAIGPLIAAFLVRVSGELTTIFYCALGAHAFFMLFVLFIVPESLTKKRQKFARERHRQENERLAREGRDWLWAVKKGNILAPLKILWPTGPGSSGYLRANLILLSAVDTIIFGVAMGAMTAVIYYTGFKFGWGTAQSSTFISIVSVTRVLTLIVFLPVFLNCVRGRRADEQRRDSSLVVPDLNSGTDSLDLNIVRFSILLETLGFAGYALARTGPLFVLSGVLAALGGGGSPTLQSALTKMVPHDRVGQLLGASGLLHALARVVFPALFNLIYAKTVGSFPQTVFVIVTSGFALAFFVSWFIRPNVYLNDINEPSADLSRGEIITVSNILADEEIAVY